MKKLLYGILLFVITFGLLACEKPHEHKYVNGECECGEKHDCVFVEGKCECGALEKVEHTHNFVDGKCECGEVEEVKDVYSVKVLMPDGNPAPTTVKVQWCTDKNCFPTKNINENGVCENDLKDDKYYVHLEHLPEGYTYNPNAYVATAENKKLEITLSKLSTFTDGNGTEENPYALTNGIYSLTIEAEGTDGLQYFAFTTTEAGEYTIESLAVDKNAINVIDPYLGFLGEVNDTTNLDPNGNITNVANFKYKFTAEANKTYYFVVMCSKLSGPLQTFYPAEFDIMITK